MIWNEISYDLLSRPPERRRARRSPPPKRARRVTGLHRNGDEQPEAGQWQRSRAAGGDSAGGSRNQVQCRKLLKNQEMYSISMKI